MSKYPATTLVLNKGKWYVFLTIPSELRQHFNGRRQLKRSTGTSDHRDARQRQHAISTSLYSELDACKPDIRDMISDLLGYIGEADEVQRMEDEGHLEGLIQGAKIHGYAEHLGQTMARKTLAKKISYVKRMYDHAVRKGWVPHNVFAGLVLDKKVGTPKQSYIPLTPDELTKLFEQDMPDHSRRLLSILITSGMRIDEAALLDWEDIKEDQGIVYYDLTTSIVKNKGSQRRVPVHSSLSWVTPGKTGQMFPQFTRDKDGKAQASASKALMPLIRNVTDDKAKVVHSLRGNFKDAMRDAGVTKEVNDFITGHASGDVAGQYGSGPSHKVRLEAIENLAESLAHIELSR